MPTPSIPFSIVLHLPLPIVFLVLGKADSVTPTAQPEVN
jgi:hypothetical protein